MLLSEIFTPISSIQSDIYSAIYNNFKNKPKLNNVDQCKIFLEPVEKIIKSIIDMFLDKNNVERIITFVINAKQSNDDRKNIGGVVKIHHQLFNNIPKYAIMINLTIDELNKPTKDICQYLSSIISHEVHHIVQTHLYPRKFKEPENDIEYLSSNNEVEAFASQIAMDILFSSKFDKEQAKQKVKKYLNSIKRYKNPTIKTFNNVFGIKRYYDIIKDHDYSTWKDFLKKIYKHIDLYGE